MQNYQMRHNIAIFAVYEEYDLLTEFCGAWIRSWHFIESLEGAHFALAAKLFAFPMILDNSNNRPTNDNI